MIYRIINAIIMIATIIIVVGVILPATFFFESCRVLIYGTVSCLSYYLALLPMVEEGQEARRVLHKASCGDNGACVLSCLWFCENLSAFEFHDLICISANVMGVVYILSL